MNELFTEIQNAAQVVSSPNYVDIAAIIISIIALVASIVVACMQVRISNKQVEISEQQNRIALFEKRHEIYKLIRDCNYFAWLIYTFAEDGADLCKLYIMSRSNIDTIESNLENLDARIVGGQIMDSIQKLGQSEFLFSHDVTDYATALMREFQLIVVNCLVAENVTMKGIKDIKKSLKSVRDRYDSEEIEKKIVDELRPTIIS